MLFKSRYLVLMLVIMVGLAGQLAAQESSENADENYVAYLLTEINALRAQNNLPPFTYNEQLSGAAFTQADWMIANWSYAHMHGGSTPTTRAIAAGYIDYEWCCSENTFISINPSPEVSLQFWIRSGPHYRQLLSTDFDEMGIGWAIGPSRTGQVLVFGKRGNGGVDPEPETTMVETAPSGDCATSHRVSAGENLYRISLRYHTTMGAIAALNGIIDYARIYVGDVLCIPSGTSGSTTVSAAQPVRVAQANPSTNTQIVTGTAVDNWCYAGGPWGDGRCNRSSDAASRAHMWECGWFKARGMNEEGC